MAADDETPQDSVFDPEPGTGALNDDDTPYEVPEDFDPANEVKDLHDCEEA